MYDTSTLPSPRLSHLPFKKEEKLQLGVSEWVSACKGNENNRKVVSFPIIFSRNIKILLCEGTQTATKALYLFYFEQIIQHHLVLNVLPTSIMLYTIRSYHREMESFLRSCSLLEQLPALD